MRKILKTLSLIVLVSFSICVAAAQTEAEMEEDAERIHSIHKRVVTDIKDFRLNESGTGLKIGENYPAYQQALDSMNKTRLLRDDNLEFFQKFAEKYAPEADEDWKAARAITAKFGPLDLDYNVGLEFQSISERFEYLKTAGERNAFSALKQVANTGTGDGAILRNLSEIYRVKAIEEARNLLIVAVLFDPGNETIERRAERLRTEVDETLKVYKEEEARILQSRTWKKGVTGTSSGTPASLAASGKSFLNSQPDWGGNTKRGTKILKVSIIGDWFVAERDALGRPTRYGLPAAVAVSDNSMDPGVVTVYEISLITKFPKMEPNFYGVWVGNVWRMLEKNLPK
ncbi:MAG: hypothetical protein R2681_02915 [Pyrinomonadaceae bacterium]